MKNKKDIFVRNLNKFYHKIKPNTYYKPYFKISIPFNEDEKQSIISKKLLNIIPLLNKFIYEFLNIKDEDAKEIYHFNKNEVITTNINIIPLLNKFIYEFLNIKEEDAKEICHFNKKEVITTKIEGNIKNIIYEIVIDKFQVYPYYIYDYIKDFSSVNKFYDYFDVDVYKDNYKYEISIGEEFSLYISNVRKDFKNIEINPVYISNMDKYVSKNKLDNQLKITEKYDRKALLWMIKNVENIRKICKYKENSNGKFDYNIELHLCKILKSLDGGDTQTVIFQPTENNSTGRKHATNASYQNIARKIRHTLAKSFYIDIDFVNCHFMLALHLCKLYKLPIDKYIFIKNWVENRAFYINDLMKNYNYTRDKAKSVIISITYGAVFDLTKISWFEDFKKEVKFLSEFFSTHTDFSNFLTTSNDEIKIETEEAIIKKEVYIPNLYGKTFSKILCSYENKCLGALLEFFTEKEIIYASLAFDGCMLEKSGKLTQELFKDANKYIFDKTNITIETIYKPLDDILEMPKDYIYTLENEYIIENNEVDACKFFIENHKHILNGYDNLRYIKRNNVWNSNKFVDEVINILKTIPLCYIGIGGVKQLFFKDKNRLKNVAELIQIDDSYLSLDFKDKIFNSTFYNISFLDGVYFFKTKEFQKYPVDDVYSTIKMNRNFPLRNNAVIDEVYKRILNPVFVYEEQKTAFLNFMSRALAGHIIDKQWMLNDGLRNS